jgi:hypothetical protein
MVAKTQALNDSHVTAGPRVVTEVRNQAPVLHNNPGNGLYFAIFEYIHDFSRFVLRIFRAFRQDRSIGAVFVDQLCFNGFSGIEVRGGRIEGFLLYIHHFHCSCFAGSAPSSKIVTSE